MRDLVDLMQRSHVHQQNWRNGDPDTSRQAGIAANRFRHTDCAAIYDVLRASPVALAAEQISDALAWGNHVRVNRRLKEMVDAAAIVRTDDPPHINRSGRSAGKYRVA